MDESEKSTPGVRRLYFDLEDQDDRNRLANSALFFEHTEDRLVILDEIHRMPELFQTLRGVIDKGRRKQKGKGRFLILGSASIDLLRQSGETLAGRIAYIDLGPLSPLEIENDRPASERLWLRGGFPDSYLATGDRDSLALRKDFIRTYLERDVPMFGPRLPRSCRGRPLSRFGNTRSDQYSSADGRIPSAGMNTERRRGRFEPGAAETPTSKNYVGYRPDFSLFFQIFTDLHKKRSLMLVLR